MYMRAVSNTGCMPCDWASATAAECTCGTSSCTRLLAGALPLGLGLRLVHWLGLGLRLSRLGLRQGWGSD